MLVSPNSRPLGRSPRWFGDLAACQTDARKVGAPGAVLTPTVIAVSGTGQWQWRITDIAVSTRTYLRQHECEYNVRRFIEALPDAQFVPRLRFINGR
jgi:hypothetical protein